MWRPLWLLAMLDQYKVINVKFKKVEEDHYRITVKSADSTDESKAIIVAPALEKSVVLRELKTDILVHVNDDHGVDGAEFAVDYINIDDDNTLEFIFGDDIIMTIGNALYVISEEEFI